MFLKRDFSAELGIVSQDELKEEIEPAGFHAHADAMGPQWSLPGFHNPDRTEELGKRSQSDTRMFPMPGGTITQCLSLGVYRYP